MKYMAIWPKLISYPLIFFYFLGVLKGKKEPYLANSENFENFQILYFQRAMESMFMEENSWIFLWGIFLWHIIR